MKTFNNKQIKNKTMKEEKEEVKKDSTEQEESNGALMFKFIIGMAGVGYMIYVLTK
jgi:hypothetical protein